LAGPIDAAPCDSEASCLGRTNAAIRSAFARGDIPAILSYHHPDVTKALAYDHYFTGRAGLEADLRSTLDNYSLEFLQNDIEILSIHGDIATEQILFSIRGIPTKARQAGAPWAKSSSPPRLPNSGQPSVHVPGSRPSYTKTVADCPAQHLPRAQQSFD
jgi:hypothetical protein